jgi:hypothetical protein
VGGVAVALERTLREPVDLTDPFTLREPEPVPGCDVCEAAKKQWRQATDVESPEYDLSRATDLAVEIRSHPHPRKRTRQ